MFQKPFRNYGRGDGMDEYLMSVGLWRKTIPKDETSLFRAVAEQVFYTQVLHEEVKKSCHSYIERNHAQLVQNWIGALEIKAMALLFKRDFIVYKHPGKEPVNVTGFGFRDLVVLCASGGDHYDSVYSRLYMEATIICQSTLYELLYENVFGVDQAMRKGQEMISAKPSQVVSHSCCSLCEPSSTLVCSVVEKPSCHVTPFPYKVAKSLSVEVFRNVEYDAWLESKKEDQALAFQKQLLTQPGIGNFTPGDKCRVVLDEHGERQFNAHIQEVKAESESAVVFVEELGLRQVVPWNKMTLLPKLVVADSTWKKRGKKKICECARNLLMENESLMGSKSHSMPHCQYMGRRIRINSAGLPVKIPQHDTSCCTNMHSRQTGKSYHNRDMFSTLGPRLKNFNRLRYNSEGHYSDEVEEKQIDDSVFSERKDQKDSEDMNMNGELQHQPWNNGCSEPEYGDTPETITAFQPLTDECNGGERLSYKQLREHDLVAVDKSLPSVPVIGASHASAVTTVVHGLPEMTNSSTMQPVLQPPPGYLVAVPYHHVMIPVGDNFAGPINTNVLPSVEPSGQDLPLRDIPTIRFFFNLGVQYYRSVLLIQQQGLPHSSVQPCYSFPTNNGNAVCLSQSVPVAAPETSYAISDIDMFPGGSFCQAGVLPPSGGIYFSSSPNQCSLPPFFQFGMNPVPYQPSAM